MTFLRPSHCRRFRRRPPESSDGLYLNPILDHDFPDPAIILAPDGFYYAYATQTAARRRMDQHPGRALGRPDRLGATRRRASRETGLGADHAGLLGAERDLRWLDLLHVLFGDARRLRPSPARACARGRHRPTIPAGPFVDMGMPLLLGAGFEFIDPHAFDDPGDGQAPALLGLGLPADPGAGARPRPHVLRARQRAGRPHLAERRGTAASRAWSRRPG